MYTCFSRLKHMRKRNRLHVFEMSNKQQTASAVVRRPRTCGNPCSIATTVFMFLLVICLHVVFYQSTRVHHPQRQATSKNASRHQATPATPSNWTSTSTKYLTTSPNSLYLEQWMLKTRISWNGRIRVPSNNVNRTETKDRHGLQFWISGGNARDRGHSDGRVMERNRLLTHADNQSSAFSHLTLPANVSSIRSLA